MNPQEGNFFVQIALALVQSSMVRCFCSDRFSPVTGHMLLGRLPPLYAGVTTPTIVRPLSRIDPGA